MGWRRGRWGRTGGNGLAKTLGGVQNGSANYSAILYGVVGINEAPVAETVSWPITT